MKMNKILSLSLLPLLLFVSPALAYAQPVEEQANLTTYENKDYDFSVGYPGNWTVREFNLGPNEVVIFEGAQPNEKIAVRITSMQGFEGKTMIDLTNTTKYEDYKKNREGIRSVQENITEMSGFPALQEIYYDSTTFSNLKAIETAALSNNTNTDLYSISYVSDPAYFDEFLPQMYQIIKSFKIGLES